MCEWQEPQSRDSDETVIARGSVKSPLGDFVEATERAGETTEDQVDVSFHGGTVRSWGVWERLVIVDIPGLSKRVWKGCLPGGGIWMGYTLLSGSENQTSSCASPPESVDASLNTQRSKAWEHARGQKSSDLHHCPLRMLKGFLGIAGRWAVAVVWQGSSNFTRVGLPSTEVN